MKNHALIDHLEPYRGVIAHIGLHRVFGSGPQPVTPDQAPSAGSSRSLDRSLVERVQPVGPPEEQDPGTGIHQQPQLHVRGAKAHTPCPGSVGATFDE